MKVFNEMLLLATVVGGGISKIILKKLNHINRMLSLL